MAELIITKIPGRNGLYLVLQDGASIEALARFSRGARSAEKFVDWCVKAGIRYEDTRGKENSDGLLREETEEAGVGPGQPGGVRSEGAPGAA